MALESTLRIVHLGDEGRGGFVIWQKLKANYSQLVGSGAHCTCCVRLCNSDSGVQIHICFCSPVFVYKFFVNV